MTPTSKTNIIFDPFSSQAGLRTSVIYSWSHARVSFGQPIAWNCFLSACFVNVFEYDSAWVLFLHTGDQCITVHVLPEAEISGLQGTQNQHRQNIENLFKQRISPGLDRIRKDRDVLETSRHTDKRPQAQRTKIFRLRYYNHVDFLVSEVDLPFTRNDGIGCVENQSLNAHLSILSLDI